MMRFDDLIAAFRGVTLQYYTHLPFHHPKPPIPYICIYTYALARGIVRDRRHIRKNASIIFFRASLSQQAGRGPEPSQPPPNLTRPSESGEHGAGAADVLVCEKKKKNTQPLQRSTLNLCMSIFGGKSTYTFYCTIYNLHLIIQLMGACTDRRFQKFTGSVALLAPMHASLRPCCPYPEQNECICPWLVFLTHQNKRDSFFSAECSESRQLVIVFFLSLSQRRTREFHKLNPQI